MNSRVRSLPATLVVAAVVLAGCASSGRPNTWQYLPNKQGDARFWVSPDDNETLIVHPETGRAWYFNNTAKRLCFAYSVSGVPGEWVPSTESGLFRVSDGAGRIGVAVYSAHELRGMPGGTLVEKAAARNVKTYENWLGELKFSIEPFDAGGAEAVSWEGTGTAMIEGKPNQVAVGNILVALGSDWVVQISVRGTPDDKRVVEEILASFVTTAEPDCFRSAMSALWQELGGF